MLFFLYSMVHARVVNPLSDLLEDNGRVFDAQGTYDDSGNYKGRDTPAEGPNEAQLRRAADPSLGLSPGASPHDEDGNAWPGVWGEFQAVPPYLEAYRLQAAQQRTK